jgi:hypothetical protein
MVVVSMGLVVRRVMGRVITGFAFSVVVMSVVVRMIVVVVVDLQKVGINV